MKQQNILVSVILAAAILLSAYAVGLLIKHTRPSESQPQAQSITEPNGVSVLEPVVAEPGGDRRSTGPTREDRARLKEERAKQLAELENLTEEQKAQLRDEMRARLTSQPNRDRYPKMTAEQEAWLGQRWPELSADQREAINQRLQRGELPEIVISDVNAPSSSESDVPEKGDEEVPSDPNRTGQN